MFLTIVNINQAKALMGFGFDEKCKNFFQEVQSLNDPSDYNVSLIEIEDKNKHASPSIFFEVNKQGYYERRNIPAPNMMQVSDWLLENYGMKMTLLQNGPTNFCYCIRDNKQRVYTKWVSDPTVALYMAVSLAIDLIASDFEIE